MKVFESRREGHISSEIALVAAESEEQVKDVLYKYSDASLSYLLEFGTITEIPELTDEGGEPRVILHLEHSR